MLGFSLTLSSIVKLVKCTNYNSVCACVCTYLYSGLCLLLLLLLLGLGLGLGLGLLWPQWWCGTLGRGLGAHGLQKQHKVMQCWAAANTPLLLWWWSCLNYFRLGNVKWLLISHYD